MASVEQPERASRSESLGSFGSHGSGADRSALLFPAMDHPSRVGTRSSSVFSLVATLVGGGCLSLPFAFQKTGIALGLFYLFGSAIVSGYSFRLLLSCSRRTGAQNYEECGEKAFGPRVKFVTMGLLIVMTFLASVAYLILARDLATPLVESYVVGHKTTPRTHSLVALMCLLPVAPLCYARSLHSLRFTSLVSLLALSLLSVAIVYRCVERAQQRPIRLKDLDLANGSPANTIYAMPFFELSFMAHFNLLPVHMGLRKPTRRRLDQVVFFTMFSALLFYMLISFSGYLFAFDHKCGKHSSSTCKDGVPDNILNVFDLHDGLIDMGRFGFLLAILLSFPLLILPCRDTLLRLVRELRASRSTALSADDYVRLADVDAALVPPLPPGVDAAGAADVGDDAGATEGTDGGAATAASGATLLSSLEGVAAIGNGGGLDTDVSETLTIIDSFDSPEFRTPQLRRQELRAKRMGEFDLRSREGFVHVATTTALVVLVAVFMYAIPGVAVVWNITGSTVAMVLAFVFPSAFYIKIRSPEGFWHPHGKDSRFIAAWLLFVFSVLATVVCSIESVLAVVK